MKPLEVGDRGRSAPSSATGSVMGGSGDEESGSEGTGSLRQESYFTRRRHSELVNAKDVLQDKLRKLKLSTTAEISHAESCDNLLEMAFEIHSKTLDYLNEMNFGMIPHEVSTNFVFVFKYAHAAMSVKLVFSECFQCLKLVFSSHHGHSQVCSDG